MKLTETRYFNKDKSGGASSFVNFTVCFSEQEYFSFFISRGIIKPGATHSNEFDAKLDVGTIEKVKFLWNNHVVNPSFPKVGAAKITVQKGEERTEYVSSFAELSGDVCRGCL
jgi:hypothetical protein